MHFRVMDGDSGPSIPPALRVDDADAPRNNEVLMHDEKTSRGSAGLLFALCVFLSCTESARRVAGGPWLNPIAQAGADAVIRAYRSPKTLTSGLPERRRALPYQSSRLLTTRLPASGIARVVLPGRIFCRTCRTSDWPLP